MMCLALFGPVCHSKPSKPLLFTYIVDVTYKNPLISNNMNGKKEKSSPRAQFSPSSPSNPLPFMYVINKTYRYNKPFVSIK